MSGFPLKGLQYNFSYARKLRKLEALRELWIWGIKKKKLTDWAIKQDRVLEYLDFWIFSKLDELKHTRNSIILFETLF